MTRPLRLLRGVIPLLLAAGPLGAQSVRGELVEQGTGRPIEGAMVVLLDAEGRQVAAALTGSDGRFRIGASAAGEYRLRAERVGYASASSPALRLAAGAELPYRMAVASEAVHLEGIVVQGERRRCVVRPGAGLATQRLWEEARKALSAAALGERTRLYQFRLRRFERDLDPTGTRVEGERVQPRVGYGDRPFASLSPEQLAADGYVQPDGTGTRYYLPDAHALLSDAFLETHCFRVTDDPTSGLVGLAFEPVGGRRKPDVRGTLWIDPGTAELRHLEVAYTGLHHVGAERAGGVVEFERLPSGAWIVRRWALRMPRVGVQEIRIGQHTERREQLLGLLEEGGEVVEVRDASGRPVRGAPLRAALSGVVRDGIHARPLAGARVYLSGTSHATEADSAGRFRLEDLPAGSHSVSVLHPHLRALAVPSPARVVELRAGETVEVELAGPSASDVLRALCPDASPGEGVALGTARDGRTGGPVVSRRLSLSWVRSGGGRARSLAVSTDPEGRFVACGVPSGAPVRAALASGEGGELTAEVIAAAGGVTVGDLVLQPRDTRAASAAADGAGDAGAVRTRVPGGYRVTRERIEAVGDAGHVGQLLRRLNLPGLQVRDDVLVTAAGTGERGSFSGLCVQLARHLSGPASCRMIRVFVNDVPAADAISTLTGIPAANVEEVVLLQAHEAGARFGTGSAEGVLLIYTR